MNYPVVKGAAYALIQANGMLLHQGTTQTSEKRNNPDSDHLKKLPDHLRSFQQAVAYPPNQAYIGNITPDELKAIPRPWFENSQADAPRTGKYGEILPEDEFLAMMKMVDIFDLLHRLSGPKGIVRQTEFFLYSDKDKEAVAQCRERGYEFPQITGWIRAHAKDLALVKEMGLKETGILTSVSDYHIFLKLNWGRKKAMDEYLGIVKAALDQGIIPRCHFEDVTRADIYGFCVPFAIELMKLREESGVDIKMRLCDTMGYGVPYPGAALPRSVPKLVRAMIDDAGVPGHLLEWHGHNDFHKVLVNSVTAWLYGCGAVNGALLGFGERTGNAPIEGMLIEYISLRGTTDGIGTTVISEIGEYFERELRYHIPPNYPFVGKNFNNTSAGIHADGLLKNEEIYNAFDTGKILNRPIRITIT